MLGDVTQQLIFQFSPKLVGTLNYVPRKKRLTFDVASGKVNLLKVKITGQVQLKLIQFGPD